MTIEATHHPAIASPDSGLERIIKLAIMAVGGQGGGVLTNWIIQLAQRNGYVAQATSVAGVAQRTGATIYYVEMTPDTGREPVFSLMPSAGDVDILVAAELMEAGRAMLRGFVTPQRTTLIASSHRMLAVSEKIVPGDGIARGERIIEEARARSKRFIAFDMEQIAGEEGTMISASLFGALAGSGALPFSVQHFEQVLGDSGRGVEASLAAFRRACERTMNDSPEQASLGGAAATSSLTEVRADGPASVLTKWNQLCKRASGFPEPVRNMTRLGLRKVVDFQDIDYGIEYLDHIERIVELDTRHGGHARDFALTRVAAKHVANAMAYDDVIGVADLKTRPSRFERVRREVGVGDGEVLHLTEFMHPRGEEVCGMMPRRLGQYIESRPRLFGALDKLVNRGRRVRTDSLFWFLLLYILAGMRRHRRRLLRHHVESIHLQQWLDDAMAHAPENYDLVVELINNRRLIKGYSDTHARSQSKFDRVMSMAPRIKTRDDAAEVMRSLREAALADERGDALEQLIKDTIE
jgi:indolepyruvate ferredoxin oxidoreductase, beta subunit